MGRLAWLATWTGVATMTMIIDGGDDGYGDGDGAGVLEKKPKRCVFCVHWFSD